MNSFFLLLLIALIIILILSISLFTIVIAYFLGKRIADYINERLDEIERDLKN